MAANNQRIILAFLICLLPHIIFSSASAQENDTKAYVDALCSETPYPKLCVLTLTNYVRSRDIKNPEELAQRLFKNSRNLVANTMDFLLKEVENLKTLLSHQEDDAFVRACLNLLTKVSDSLNHIKSRLIRGGGGGVVAMNGNNLERWTSTALTDAETLVSKFQGRRLGKLESKIYGKVKYVEETTSNALAILQHFAASRH